MKLERFQFFTTSIYSQQVMENAMNDSKLLAALQRLINAKKAKISNRKEKLYKKKIFQSALIIQKSDKSALKDTA